MPIGPIQPITSLEGPDLQPYRTMKRDAVHRKNRIFVATGDKVVQRLLESHYEVVSLLLPQKWLETLKPLVDARREVIKVFTAERKMLEELTGFSMYQGVMAIGRIPDPVPITAQLKSQPRPYLLTALEDLTNSENLGGLVRNCAAFGVSGLIVGETCTSPFLRRAVRASMGTIFRLPVYETERLAHTLMELKQQGIRIVAAHARKDQTYLSRAVLKEDCCIVFGSEGYGLSDKLVDLCDDSVCVPMANEVDSLNVASAAAVFLYEAARQQGKV